MQWAGLQAHRGIIWIEEYDPLAAMEQADHTPACDQAWAPMHALTLPGTDGRSVWFDARPDCNRGTDG